MQCMMGAHLSWGRQTQDGNMSYVSGFGAGQGTCRLKTMAAAMICCKGSL